MKEGLIKILAVFLNRRYKPAVVFIIGGAGKVMTKKAIEIVLRQNKVRVSLDINKKELALALAFLSDKNPKGWWQWFLVFGSAVLTLVFKKKDYPEVIVADCDLDNPEASKGFLAIAKPNVVVVCPFGSVPPFVERFSGPKAVLREAARLVAIVPASGQVVMNFDDEGSLSLRDKTKAEIRSYGFCKGVDIRAVNMDLKIEDKRMVTIFKLQFEGSLVPVKVMWPGGEMAVWSSLAAASVGLIFGVNLVKISQALSSWPPLEGEMKVRSIAGGIEIIDNTKDFSLLSVLYSLFILRRMSVKRKVAVIGDLPALGRYTAETYEEIGRLMAKSATILITIGGKSRLAAEAAVRAGKPKKNIFSFDSIEEAKVKIGDILKLEDSVLINGKEAMEIISD